MDIRVYNDGLKVHEGTLEKFLQDNANDEWLTAECAKLNVQPRVAFHEISGEWIIEKKELAAT